MLPFKRIEILVLLLFLMISGKVNATAPLSYSGRLVNSNGSPVNGPVKLKFDLAYTTPTGVGPVLCSQLISNVDLSNGVFHVKLDPDCSPTNLTSVLAQIPSGESIVIQVTDESAGKSYSYQALNSVPSAIVASQLEKMNATPGQLLGWDGSKWVPTNEAGTGTGTVTSVGTGSGLVGGPITSVGTISIATDGVEGFHLKDGSITDTDISATAEIDQSKIKNLTTDLAAKESLISSGASTDYLNGIKSWTNFDQSVRNALLLGYTSGSATPLSATDNVMEALSKLEGQIIANDTAFDNAGQWDKDGSLIYYNTGNVGIGTATPSEKLDVTGNLALSGRLRLKDSGSNYVELKAPTTIAGTVTFTLPGTLGTNGQVLVTDALGNLSWSTPSTSSAEIVDGSIVDADVSGSASIAQSKIANLTTDLAAKEPTLIAGTAAQYLRGDKSWQTLNTDAVAEGTKLYFTEPRVLGTDLAGLSAVAGSVTDSDSVLSAIGKLTGNQSNHVLKAGDTMNGNLLMGGNTVTGLGAPLLNSDAATKLYVDTEVNNKAYWTKTVNDLSYSTGNVGVGTATPTNKLDVVGDVALSGKLRLKSDTANYIELKAPLSLGSTQTYIFPATTGTSGYALTTNGTGTLSWSAVATTSSSVGGDLSGTIASAEIVSGAVGSTEIADLSIANADIANTTITYNKLNLIDGDIPQAKVNGLATALGGKEPTITAGTTAQYWRGDKSWQTLNTTSVPEGTNLYFLDSRVRGALLSGYVAGSATPLAATDTLLEALAKLEGQMIANKAAFDSTGQWNKNGTSVYYNGGNVGIGVTTPLSKFHVNGTIRQQAEGTYGIIEGNTYADPNYATHFIGYRSRGTALASTYPQSGDGLVTFQGRDGIDRLHIGGISIDAAENFSLTAKGTSMRFTTTPVGTVAPAERMKISSEGNVGIGTSTPTSKLDVNGDIALTGDLKMAGGDSYIWTNGTGTGFTGIFDSANSRVLVYASEATGNVGIGTTSPVGSLQVNNNGGTIAGTSASIANAAINIVGGSPGNLAIDSNEIQQFGDSLNLRGEGGINISTGDTADGDNLRALTIVKSGNVGIGSTNPQAKLEVAGAAVIGTGMGAKTIGVVSFFTSNNTTANYIHIRTPYKPTVNNGMYHFKVEGYSYADSKIIDLTYVGYSYTTSPTVIQNPQSRDPQGFFAPTQYIGSNGYIYLRFKPGNVYYTSFRVDSTYVGNGRIIYPGEMTVTESSAPTL